MASLGREPAHPAATGSASTSSGSSGQVDLTYDVEADAVVGGRVTATRPATVVLKMSYHPRWTATIDGHRAQTFMVAPGFLAVAVPQGDHLVEFRYHAVSGWETLAWFGLGALVLVLLAGADRRRSAGGLLTPQSRRHLAVAGLAGGPAQPEPGAAGVDVGGTVVGTD